MSDDRPPPKPCARTAGDRTGCDRRRLTPAGDETWTPRTAETGNLCDRCANTLHRWLTEIPDLYAQLDLYAPAGIDGPHSIRGRRSHSPALIRLDVLALLDPRSTTGPNGQPTGNVHGVMVGWAQALHDELGLTTDPPAIVDEACAFLTGPWWTNLCQQDFITDLYAETRTVHRQLTQAVGVEPPQPAGRCQCGRKLYHLQGDTTITCKHCGHRVDGLAIVRLAAAQRLQDGQVSA